MLAEITVTLTYPINLANYDSTDFEGAIAEDQAAFSADPHLVLEHLSMYQPDLMKINIIAVAENAGPVA